MRRKSEMQCGRRCVKKLKEIIEKSKINFQICKDYCCHNLVYDEFTGDMKCIGTGSKCPYQQNREATIKEVILENKTEEFFKTLKETISKHPIKVIVVNRGEKDE